DPAHPERASITASIPVNSVDVANERLMSRLMEADLLGGSGHPIISFRRTRVAPTDAARWKVTGHLTIHGVTKPVVLDTHFLGQGVHPFSKKVSAAFRAETGLDRRQVGGTWDPRLDTGGPYLGERVNISIVILAARQD